MIYPTISVIILNYNSLDHLPANLASLERLDYPRNQLEIVLADNNSTDGSLDWVTEHHPTVSIVQNGANLGFADGNTAGARAVKSEWVAFLNPDTRVEPNWLTELIQPALRDPNVVCVASRMLTWDGQAIDFADAAINFMGWGCQPGYGSHKLSDLQDKLLLFACGGAMLIKRQVFLDAGGFDADYFAYYEDVDLGWRLWLMGYQVAFAARAIVYHRHHGSWSSVSDAKRWMLAERNTLFTIVKNYQDEHLARTLPASLLLMAQRAYLDIRPDFASRPPSAPAAFGPSYYGSVVKRLLRAGDYQQLVQRVTSELGRRWQRLRTPARPLPRRTTRLVDGCFEIPTVALARLVAARQVLHAFSALATKRRAIQSARQRTDRQVFPLFQWALVSNFDDAQFIRAMQRVIERFELNHIFDDKIAPAVYSSDAVELGRQVSLAMLNVMDRALTLSNVPDEGFSIGGPALEPVQRVPYASVAILAQMNDILWTLPGAPLENTLAELLQGCQRILSAS